MYITEVFKYPKLNNKYKLIKFVRNICKKLYYTKYNNFIKKEYSF